MLHIAGGIILAVFILANIDWVAGLCFWVVKWGLFWGIAAAIALWIVYNTHVDPSAVQSSFFIFTVAIGGSYFLIRACYRAVRRDAQRRRDFAARNASFTASAAAGARAGHT